LAFEELKAQQSVAWGAGAYEPFVAHYESMLEHLTARLHPGPGERWLDVASGTGALAERAARAGAEVTGVDLAPALVDTARRRASEAGLSIVYDVGDAECLPYPDAGFDVVASNLGAVVAPDHEAVAGELARVCRPGGRLGLTWWRAEPSNCGAFDVVSRFLAPSPVSIEKPFAWSRPAYVEDLLGDAFDLRFEEGDAPLRAESGEAVWHLFSTVHGPTRMLAESLDPDRREELRRDFVAFYEQFRTNGGISRPGPYLLVTGTRR
jgi:SAM-dependent methyltransferase